MDDIDWSEEPPAHQLEQLTPYDFDYQIEARWRDTTSGEEGELSELSERPGATWDAPWAGVRCIRLSDGTVFQEPLPAAGSSRARGMQRSVSSSPGRERPIDLLRTP